MVVSLGEGGAWVPAFPDQALIQRERVLRRLAPVRAVDLIAIAAIEHQQFGRGIVSGQPPNEFHRLLAQPARAALVAGFVEIAVLLHPRFLREPDSAAQCG